MPSLIEYSLLMLPKDTYLRLYSSPDDDNKQLIVDEKMGRTSFGSLFDGAWV